MKPFVLESSGRPASISSVDWQHGVHLLMAVNVVPKPAKDCCGGKSKPRREAGRGGCPEGRSLVVLSGRLSHERGTLEPREWPWTNQPLITEPPCLQGEDPGDLSSTPSVAWERKVHLLFYGCLKGAHPALGCGTVTFPKNTVFNLLTPCNSPWATLVGTSSPYQESVHTCKGNV